MLPHESPVHYGLHPNAEIEFLTVTSDNLFHTLLELQSPDAVMGEGASQTLEEKVLNRAFACKMSVIVKQQFLTSPASR